MSKPHVGLEYILNSNISTLESMVSIKDNGVEVDIIANAAKEAIIKMGGLVTNENLDILKTAASVLLGEHVNTNKVAVVPAECGMGKSTLIREYLKYKLSSDPDFGAIIVKERIADIIELEQALGGRARALYSFNPTECLKQLSEYNRTACRSCDLNCKRKRARIEQKNYPVVIISDEKLRMLMLYQKDLGELQYFFDRDGNKKNRQILIIDEKPPITINKAILRKDLEAVYEVTNKIKVDSENYDEATRLKEKIVNLNYVLTSLEKSLVYLQPLDTEFCVSKELKSYFGQHYENNDVEVLELIASVIKKGGVIRHENSKINLEGQIFTVDYLKYNHGIKTVIFDATALYDVDYGGDQFLILQVPPIREYSNLDINNCKEINLSRSSLLRQNKPIEIDALFQDLNFISGKELFVLTYLMHEHSIRKSVNISGICAINKKVHIDHFNNIKGKNDYAEADVMIMYGVNYKTDAFYIAKAKSLGIELCNTEYKRSKKGRLSTNTEITKVMYSDMFVEMIQSIFRTKLRKNTSDPIQLYCFNPYDDVITMLSHYFRNARINKWFPETFYQYYLNNETKKDRKILELLHYLAEYFGNTPEESIKLSLSKEDIRVAIKYKNQGTLASHLKSEYVVYKLQQLGVEISYHELKKQAS